MGGVGFVGGAVGGGIVELRIDYGPGYRTYFAYHGDVIVILLCGGDKRTQNSNIETANEYWNNYKMRKEND